MPLRPDDVHRTVLLAAHDGSQPTLEEALAAHARTGIVICADPQTCDDITGQAALLTAVVTARRAFGNVVVLAAQASTIIPAGIFAGQTIASAVTGQGGQLVHAHAPAVTGQGWPVLLLGSRTPTLASYGPVKPTATVRASWSGWTVRVSGSAVPMPGDAIASCVPVAIAAAALGVGEAFGAVRARPGSDAGYRDVTLNLWNPGGAVADTGPALAHAPCAWWLVGLGHLGQANAWVISWLPYADPGDVEIVLQDAGRTSPANYSTGVLTPEGSDHVLKTRLTAAMLENAGFAARLIERRVGSDLRAAPDERHVAILGVDNLPARRLISDVGWELAIDIGLGDRPDTFDSILIRRFPGTQRSQEIAAWQSAEARAASIPNTPAFTDLQARHDPCGVTELAGKAVGAAFVGITAACLAIAETTRELHGGTGHDCHMLSLASMTSRATPAGRQARITSAPLRRAAPKQRPEWLSPQRHAPSAATPAP